MTKLTKLSRYSAADLKQMWKDGVITRNEMNDELDSRPNAAMFEVKSEGEISG